MQQNRFSWQLVIWAALALALAVRVGVSSSVVHAQRAFSDTSIHGRYGITYTVALPNPQGPTQFLSGTGVYDADGAGHLTGEETTNANGAVCDGTLAGTYTVNANGTGTASVAFTPITKGCAVVSFEQSLVIIDSGRIVRVADMIPTQVTIFEEWQKQM